MANLVTHAYSYLLMYRAIFFFCRAIVVCKPEQLIFGTKTRIAGIAVADYRLTSKSNSCQLDLMRQKITIISIYS